MANAQSDLDDGYDLGPTPEDVGASQEAQYEKESQGGSVQRNMATISRGMQLASGGGPQMTKAQNVQSRLQAILSDVNQGADPNEDPLTKQMRIAKAMSVGMIDVAPQIALQANQQAQRIAQAQSQQKLLSLKTEEAQTNLDQSKFKDRVQQLTGQIVFAKKGEDGGMDAYDTVSPSDPDYQTKVAAIQARAQKDGVQVMPMTADSFINGKNALAQLQAQRVAAQNDTKLKIAEMQSNERWQAAMLAAQTKGQQFSGNQAMMSNRIMSAADLGSQALQNIMETPLGGSAGGPLGIGSSPGKSIMQTGIDDLRNRVAPQEAQSLNVMFAGLARNLGTIEAQGGLQGAQAFSQQIKDGIQIRDGDTVLTALTRMAEASQIIHKGTEVYLANPKLDPQVKEVIQGSLQRLESAIPFTVHDLTAFQKAQSKNPKMTFGEYAQQQGIGSRGEPDGTLSMDDGSGKIYHIPANLAAQFRAEHPNSKPVAPPGGANP